MEKSKVKISLIGAGNVGGALACAFFKKGFEILSIIDKNRSKILKLQKYCKFKSSSIKISDLDPDTNWLFITTPDSEIEKLSATVAKLRFLKFKNLKVFHTSGALTTDVLRPLKQKGATVVSFHPIQTFPEYKNLKERMNFLYNIYYGVETENKNIKFVEELVYEFDSKIIRIDKRIKPLYHLACVYASNFLVPNLYSVELIARKLKVKKWVEIFRPLINNTISNAMDVTPAKALTGPIARGDIQTIEKHFEAILNHLPEILPSYINSGIETALIAEKAKYISIDQSLKLLELFQSISKKYLGERS